MSAVTIALTLANLALAASCAAGAYYLCIIRQRKRVGSSDQEDCYSVALPVSKDGSQEVPTGCYRMLALLCPCLVPLPKLEWELDESSSSSSDQASRPSSGGTQPGEVSRPHRPLLGRERSGLSSTLSLSSLKPPFLASERDEGWGTGTRQEEQSPILKGQFLRVEEWDGVRALPTAQVLAPPSLSPKVADGQHGDHDDHCLIR